MVKPGDVSPPLPSFARSTSSPSAGVVGVGPAVFAPPGLEAQLDRADRRITARGELDYAAARVLADLMDTVIVLDPGDSTIDLAGVDFLDAGGVGVLVGFANQLADLGARLTLTGARPRLRRVFDLVGLIGMLEELA